MHKNKGITLIEAVIGMTLLILIISTSVLTLRNLAKSSASTHTKFKVDQRLQSVADELRQLAFTNFQVMNSCTPIATDSLTSILEPVKIRGFVDLDVSGQPIMEDDLVENLRENIYVFRRVGQIDTDSMTRHVNLRAVWKDGGTTQHKKMDFDLGRMREKSPGGVIRVVVVNGIDGFPINGIIVTAEGEDSSTVRCITGITAYQNRRENGVCYLQKVRSVNNLPVTLDGNYLGRRPLAYFHTAATGGSIESRRTYVSAPEAAGVEPASFKRIFTIPQAVSPLNPIPTVLGPIDMYPTATVTGLITDPETNPIQGSYVDCDKPSGVVLALRKRPGTLVIDSSTVLTAMTSKGRYEFRNVVPGQYSIHVLGSLEYAAQGINGDFDPNDTSLSTFRAVESSTTVTVNGQALRKGSIALSVQGLTHDGSGEYYAEGSLSSPIKLILSMLRYRSFRPNNTSASIGVTVPYENYYGNPSGPIFSYVQAGPHINPNMNPAPSPSPSGSGFPSSYSFFNVSLARSTVTVYNALERTVPMHAPAIIEGRFGDAVATGQYNTVGIEAAMYIPSPYVPVLYHLRTSGSPSKTNLIGIFRAFRVHDRSIYGELANMFIFPSGVGSNPFSVNVFTNHLTNVSNQNHNYYILREDALSDVRGRILFDANNDGTPEGDFIPTAPATGPLQYSYVYVDAVLPHYGGIMRNPNKEGGKNFIAHVYPVATDIKSDNSNTTISMPTTHTYSMKRNKCVYDNDAVYENECVGLIPTLNSEQITLNYFGILRPTVETVNLSMLIEAYEKQKNSSTAVQISASGDIRVHVRSGPQCDPGLIESATSSYYQGEVLFRNGRSIEGSNTYISGRRGVVQEVIAGQRNTTLNPGQTMDNVDIVVHLDPSRKCKMMARAADTGDAIDWVWLRDSNTNAVYFYPETNAGETIFYARSTPSSPEVPIKVMRKITVRASGRVIRDVGDTPINGIRVTLSGNGFDPLITQTNSNGEYTFPLVKAVPVNPVYNPEGISDSIVLTFEDIVSDSERFNPVVVSQPLYNAYGLTGDSRICNDSIDDGMGSTMVPNSCMRIIEDVTMDENETVGKGL